VSTQLDQPASQGPVGGVGGAGSWAGVPGKQRGLADAGGNHIRAHACEPEGCGVSATLVTYCLCQPKRRMGCGCLGLCLK